MAYSDISLLGATYPTVPSVLLPKSGGGNVQFYDVSQETTAVESDVTAGKKFFKADGSVGTGTASGGGGATNVVSGSFLASNSGGGVLSVSLNYSGSGYPVAAVVWVDGGAYNESATSGYPRTWYNSVQRYAVGFWSMSKADCTHAPTYSSSGSENYGVTCAIYKNSTSTATSYTRTSSMTSNTFSSSAGNAAYLTCVRFTSNTKMSVYSAKSNGQGLLAGMKYSYVVIYSS